MRHVYRTTFSPIHAVVVVTETNVDTTDGSRPTGPRRTPPRIVLTVSLPGAVEPTHSRRTSVPPSRSSSGPSIHEAHVVTVSDPRSPHTNGFVRRLFIVHLVDLIVETFRSIAVPSLLNKHCDSRD